MAELNAEIWKTIPSIPTHEVSDRGRVRRRKGARNWVAGKVLSPKLDRKGYLWVTLSGYHRAVHSLICEAFNGPRKPGQMCRHLNDIKLDNRPENLAWGSMRDNAADARRNGRMARVHRRFDRDEAIRLYRMGLNLREIGHFLGVTHAAVSYGLRGTGYRSLVRETPLSPTTMM